MEKRFPMTYFSTRSLRSKALAGWLTLSACWLATGCATPYHPAYPTAGSAGSSNSTAPAVVTATPVDTATATTTAPAATSTASTVVVNEPPVAALFDLPADTDAAAVAAPVDPMRPDIDVDLNDVTARSDLWVRIRRGFKLPRLDNDLVRDREAWYTSRPEYVERMTARGGRYLFHIVEELEARKMPTELALLPFIESAFNPQAMSSAKASGIWQFMPATGRNFALKQNIFRDDRRDVLASTRAALDYLQRLYNQFGDWHLALAAYNWGEGNVQRALTHNKNAGLPTDYQSLKMPNETRYYVPKFQAVKNIIAKPDAYAVTLPALANHPYFLSVPIKRDIDVDLAARLAGMSLDEFKTLNPQMNKPVILAAGTPQVLLPYDNASAFVRSLAGHRGQLASWTAWVAPKTMRSADAARQVGMGEAALCEVNRIPPRMLVKAGSTLLVPRSEKRTTDVAVHVADNATMTLAHDVPPLRKVALKAGKRDSVASVAKRYRISPAQVAGWNSVAANARFKPGTTITVFLPNRKAGATRMASGKSKRYATTRVAAHGRSAHKADSRRASASAAAPKKRRSLRMAAR
jgi:membrane-bound lytic murein transglycosylase D